MKQPKKDKKTFSLTARGSESTKSFANKREVLLSKEVGGILTPNSGSTPHMKGDVLSRTKMYDLKSAKTSKQIIVSVDMLQKLLDDAFRVGRDPVLVLDFPKSNLRCKKWICVPQEDWRKDDG